MTLKNLPFDIKMYGPTNAIVFLFIQNLPHTFETHLLSKIMSESVLVIVSDLAISNPAFLAAPIL